MNKLGQLETYNEDIWNYYRQGMKIGLRLVQIMIKMTISIIIEWCMSFTMEVLSFKCLGMSARSQHATCLYWLEMGQLALERI